MHFVIGDVHGQLSALKMMLEKIGYDKNRDHLYFLGDYVDWGDDSIGVIKFIMELQENSKDVYALLGNHDLMMRKSVKHKYSMMPGICRFNNWYFNRGMVTFQQFMTLDIKEQEKIIEWLDHLPIDMEIEVDGERFILAHGAPRCAIESAFPVTEEELVTEAVWARGEMIRELSLPRTLIRGHEITESHTVEFWENDVINVDCGAKAMMLDEFGEGFRLACLCIETKEAFYINGADVKGQTEDIM